MTRDEIDDFEECMARNARALADEFNCTAADDARTQLVEATIKVFCSWARLQVHA